MTERRHFSNRCSDCDNYGDEDDTTDNNRNDNSHNSNSNSSSTTSRVAVRVARSARLVQGGPRQCLEAVNGPLDC